MIYTLDDFMKTYFPKEYEKQKREKMTVEQLAKYLAEKNIKIRLETVDNDPDVDHVVKIEK